MDDKRLTWQVLANNLREVWERDGPFDGIVGFSQGDCVAAALNKMQASRVSVPERACVHEKKGAYSSRIVSKHGKVTHEAWDDETSVATAQTEAGHDMLGATSCSPITVASW